MQLYLLDIINGKRRGFIPSIIHKILYILSLGYKTAVKCRNFAFDQQWISQQNSHAPLTISIGNITVGGTGKTPITLMLAKEFYPNTQIAILSRGYRSKAEKLPTPLVLSRGVGPLYPPEYAGDEPYLLSRAFPKAIFIIGRDRCKAAKMAVETGAKVLILDDGLQHRYLKRDFDILTMDGNDPFNNEKFLPYGLLRDSLQSIKRAHLIILNGLKDPSQFEKLLIQFKTYTEAPVIATSLEAKHICLSGGRTLPSLKDKKIAIFCGIANPERFVKTVNDLGAHIVHQKFVADHKGLTTKELDRFAIESADQGAEFIFCTEKDHVKLPFDYTSQLPIGWLQMQMEIQYGAEHWKAFVDKAKLLIDSK